MFYLYRGLDPRQAFNALVYNPSTHSNAVPKAALRTEELSVWTDLSAVSTQCPGWKVAAFRVDEARRAGYILMRDPSDPTHILLYDKNNPDRRPSPSTAQRLANAAVILP